MLTVRVCIFFIFQTNPNGLLVEKLQPNVLLKQFTSFAFSISLSHQFSVGSDVVLLKQARDINDTFKLTCLFIILRVHIIKKIQQRCIYNSQYWDRAPKQTIHLFVNHCHLFWKNRCAALCIYKQRQTLFVSIPRGLQITCMISNFVIWNHFGFLSYKKALSSFCSKCRAFYPNQLLITARELVKVERY